ncbi:MAG: ATP-binding protein [Planctomycetes bacterium]|nr:ATP-binding protein [Planctomycetota bacterium]MCC7396484.1 AAA family ATPase [Planctomycetota bacterium]
MITKAKFEGFKLLRDVEFPMGRLNVIVGENGTGKSSILEGLHYLLQLARSDAPRLKDLFGRGREPAHLAARPLCDHFRISIETAAVRQFALSWGRSVNEQRPRFMMALQVAPEEAPREFGADAAGLAFGHDLDDLQLASVVRLRLDATQLSAPHYSEERFARVEYDGSGLATVLQELHSARDGRFDKLEGDLRKVVPGATAIRTTRERIVRRERIKISVDGQQSWSEQQREYMGAGIEVEWGGMGWVPAAHLSEGTMLALGLCTVLHHRPPKLILLDDLDKALHPKAQRELVALLRSAIAANDQLQILATTHSPFVVDEFAPEDVLVVAAGKDGSSYVRRLSDHPGWADKSRFLEAGEFWSAVGESWVAEKKA